MHFLHQRRLREIESAVAINSLPQRAQRRAVTTRQIENKALEIRRPGNVHRRAGCLLHLGRGTWPVTSAAEKLVQHVIFVGGQYQPAYRQAHHARNVAGKYVAKIARRHGERNLLRIVGCSGKIPLEVVNNLRRHTRPVDRVHRADVITGLEDFVVGYLLHDILTVVEHAGDRNIKDIGVSERIHLRRLKAAHLAMG